MAHMTFESVSDGVTSLDSNSVLAVHSLLNAETFSHISTVKLPEDNDDVFQCGKCKSKFTSINIFIDHKKVCSAAINASSSMNTVPQNSTVYVRKIQMPSFQGSGYAQNLVLTEADLLSLGLEQQSIVSTGNSSLDVSAEDSSIVSPTLDSSTLSTTIQQVIPHIQTLPPMSTSDHQQQPLNALELPLNTNKLISGQLLLMSQPNDNSGISGVVLNIGNGSFVGSNDAIIEEVNVDKTGQIITTGVADTVPVPVQDVTDDQLSTVNVIAEFHSSMVKTRKSVGNAQNEEDGSKKDHKLNCAYCCKSFTKNFDLQQHIRCHTGEKPFQCIVCGRAFAQKSNVKKHMQTHKVWPDGLARTLPPLDRLSNLSSGEDRPTIDLEPPLDVMDSDNKEDRLSEEISEKNYACPYCSYTGQTYYKLKSHMKKHDTKKVYKCILSTCGLMFNDLDPFLEHTKSHENEMTYRCHECNKNFPSLFELGAHQYTHSLYPNQRTRSPRKFFRCTMCLNKYSTPAALNHHIATSSHIYTCHYCEKVFPCERYLRRHLRIHSDSESHICSLCSKTFKTENYLKVHMLTHSENKPFECSVCKACFNRKDKLKRHLLIHEPVKRFKCPFRNHMGCVREFNRPDKLKAHIVTHSCIKPYSCRICGKTFSRIFHLREHSKMHKSKNATDKCDGCGTKFKDEKEFREHRCDKELGGSKTSFEGWGIGKKYWGKRRSRDLKSSLYINSSNYFTRGKSRFRRSSKADQELDEKVTLPLPDVSEDDNIPTAHIEIISTTGELISSASINAISLTDNFNSDSAQEEQFVDDPDQCDNNSFVTATLHITNSNFSECETLQADL